MAVEAVRTFHVTLHRGDVREHSLAVRCSGKFTDPFVAIQRRLYPRLRTDRVPVSKRCIPLTALKVRPVNRPGEPDAQDPIAHLFNGLPAACGYGEPNAPDQSVRVFMSRGGVHVGLVKKRFSAELLSCSHGEIGCSACSRCGAFCIAPLPVDPEGNAITVTGLSIQSSGGESIGPSTVHGGQEAFVPTGFHEGDGICKARLCTVQCPGLKLNNGFGPDHECPMGRISTLGPHKNLFSALQGLGGLTESHSPPDGRGTCKAGDIVIAGILREQSQAKKFRRFNGLARLFGGDTKQFAVNTNKTINHRAERPSGLPLKGHTKVHAHRSSPGIRSLETGV